MRQRGDKEGGPEKRRRQFEDSRGLSDRPELPLDDPGDEAETPADAPDDEAAAEEKKKDGGEEEAE